MKKSVVILLAIILFLFGIIFLKQKSYASKELPKVYITVEDEDAFRNLTKEDGYDLIKNATLQYDNGSGEILSSYIKIKVQGTATALKPKKNYNIKLYKDSDYTKKQNVDMGQGWGEFNKYCLKANWPDIKTHSRNIVTAKLSAKVQELYGLFTDTPNNGVIDGFPVEVILNGEFLGLYTWNIPKDAWMWNIDEDNPNHIVMEAGAETESTKYRETVRTIDRLGENKNDPNCSGWLIEAGSETQETVNKFDKLINFINSEGKYIEAVEAGDEEKKKELNKEFKRDFDKHINKEAMLNYLTFIYMGAATDNVTKNMIWVTYDGEIWYPTLYDLEVTYGKGHWTNLHTDYGYWIPEEGYDVWYNGATGKAIAPLSSNESILIKRMVECYQDDLSERWFELRKDILSDNNILKEFNDFMSEIPEEVVELDIQTWEEISGKVIKEKEFDFNQIKNFLAVRLPAMDKLMYERYSDDMPATLSLQYSTSNLTNGTVTVTAVANRNDITFGSNPTTYTFDSNGTYTFTATDGGGNDVIATATVDWIDKTAPDIEVTSSKTELTNEDVVVIIKANEKIQEVTGWELSEDKKVLTKVYEKNAQEIIRVIDLAGNIIEKTIEISNIDKDKPITEVRYNAKDKCIVAEIISNEKVQEVDGWDLSEDKLILTKTYTENVTETVKVYDIAGNKKDVLVTINNIDKTAPDIEVISSKTELTNEDVVVTIKANEKIQEVTGWKLSDDKLALTKTYTSNITETIKVMDLVGNTTDVNINLINIDKTKPELKLDYNETHLTNGKVVVIITSNEKIQEVEGWELSEDKKVLTKVYEKNAQEIIRVIDLAGNIIDTTVEISNIDKDKPIMEVRYNAKDKCIVAEIISNEKVQEVDGWDLSEDKLILTKTYTENVTEKVEVYDIAGNSTEVEIIIEDLMIHIDDKDNNDEFDEDKSTTTDMLPNTGKTEIILIAILVSTILIGITIFKLNKYKGI